MHAPFRPLLVLISLFAACLPARAEALHAVRIEQVVTLSDLVVAQSHISSLVGRDTFEIEGRLRSEPLARLFERARGTVVSRGRFERGTARPDAYLADLASGAERRQTRITFGDGRVYRLDNQPESGAKPADWVAVGGSDLVGVVDPIAATLVRAGDARDVCRRTIGIFDGVLRADLRLSPAGRGRLSARGYDGDTVVCKARLVPVSGYRAGSETLRYFSDESEIRIAFAPIGRSGVYAPVEASATTTVGTLTLETRRFEILD
ncbi:DUF3108 domain-containing protein [Nitratireductor mangrovi]|uniref:DUF3108 domain-containing protein n=1 Tax=Nitratireductor mangrovi TaxID=2599600 RepID=A0A5B8L4T7_9HYPH|nr:DUF3108 domain-containing protein [Nitratireductor mangrovi]QDZ03011.2 DUF3108 domain-containing protein [Nitratireductor mangrovi]